MESARAIGSIVAARGGHDHLLHHDSFCRRKLPSQDEAMAVGGALVMGEHTRSWLGKGQSTQTVDREPSNQAVLSPAAPQTLHKSPGPWDSSC